MAFWLALTDANLSCHLEHFYLWVAHGNREWLVLTLTFCLCVCEEIIGGLIGAEVVMPWHH